MVSQNHNSEFKSFCPSEVIINNYLIGSLNDRERDEAEKHIADCPFCIYRIAEAYEVLSEGKSKLKESFMKIIKKINIWFIGCIIMFLLSFIFQRYFLQFLVGAILLGIKWIVDNKNTKMLIMIYDAWRRGGKDEAEHILQSIQNRLKR